MHLLKKHTVSNRRQNIYSVVHVQPCCRESRCLSFGNRQNLMVESSSISQSNSEHPLSSITEINHLSTRRLYRETFKIRSSSGV